jgi:outer membrane protein assembly factor BamB
MGLLMPRRIYHTSLVAIAIVVMSVLGCGGLRLSSSVKTRELDWTSYGRVETRTNATPAVVTPPLTLLWEHDITAGIGNGSPLVVDTFVVVGNLRGELFGLNANTGKRIGWYDLGDAIQGSPIVDGNEAIVALSNTKESLVAFDLTGGKPRWRANCGDIEVSPLLHKKRIYFGTTDGRFQCVSQSNGETIWKFELPENTKRKGIRSSPATDGSSVVFGAEDGHVYALDIETGALRWRVRISAPLVAGTAILEGCAYIGDLEGNVHAIRISDGANVWSAQTGAAIYAGAAATPEVIVVGATNGTLFGFDPKSGMMVWECNLGGVVNAAAVISGSTVYVGTLKKELFAIDLKNGAILWQQSVPGRIKTAPVAVHGRLYVATDERLILAFKGVGQ